jgi:hypothetical protein
VRERLVTYIVADKAIPRPLREKSDGKHYPHSPSIARRLEERKIVARFGYVSFNAECLANLSIGEVDQWIAFTIVGMIFGEDGNSFSISSFSYEPARTLRDEPDKNNL